MGRIPLEACVISSLPPCLPAAGAPCRAHPAPGAPSQRLTAAKVASQGDSAKMRNRLGFLVEGARSARIRHSKGGCTGLALWYLWGGLVLWDKAWSLARWASEMSACATSGRDDFRRCAAFFREAARFEPRSRITNVPATVQKKP